MTTVTGRLTVTHDGVVETTDFKDIPYALFFRAQNRVVDTINAARSWGIDQICGGPDIFAGDPATGDVGYSYLVDFAGGGSSDGANNWHGVPIGAAAALAGMLREAAAVIKSTP